MHHAYDTAAHNTRGYAYLATLHALLLITSATLLAPPGNKYSKKGCGVSIAALTSLPTS